MTAPGLSLRGDLYLGDRRLLRDLALDFPAGRCSCLLGPSGAGKSTLGRLIAGLPCPHRLHGTLGASDRRPLAGRVAMLAQDSQLLPWASLTRNVLIGAHLRGDNPAPARARDLLARVGLAGMDSRRPGTLSGGQRQRVELARTLIEDRPVVVLDEAFSSLDVATRLAMQDLAARMLAGRTVVLITHDPLEAVRLAQVGWLLNDGAATPMPLPDGPTPRDYASATVQAAQARLLARLHRTAPPCPA